MRLLESEGKMYAQGFYPFSHNNLLFYLQLCYVQL